jgi:hypothetical protein
MSLEHAYLIVQDFPENNVKFVIGTKPFGIIWHNYEEALERYSEVLKEWSLETNKNNISTPKLIKITLHN